MFLSGLPRDEPTKAKQMLLFMSGQKRQWGIIWANDSVLKPYAYRKKNVIFL